MCLQSPIGIQIYDLDGRLVTLTKPVWRFSVYRIRKKRKFRLFEEPVK
jgi:hypothetical protein